MNRMAHGGFLMTIGSVALENPRDLSKSVVSCKEYGFLVTRCAAAQYSARSCTGNAEAAKNAAKNSAPITNAISKTDRIFLDFMAVRSSLEPIVTQRWDHPI
jgi:hypothetical protein